MAATRLKQLIEDVQSGAADFTTILVYDVSRWGRFQDADESAYYEYVCRRAGISVHYCAEQFENDGGPVSTIVKGVKRAMAGEYSRELSAKVFAGQCRLIELGYRQGGPAGYGLRRMLIDQAGAQKANSREASTRACRPIASFSCPGPRRDRHRAWMYRSFVKGRKARARNCWGFSTNEGSHRSWPAVVPRHGSPGSDQREIHRQQRLEPRIVQAQERSGSATVRTSGFDRKARSSPSSTGLCSKRHKRSSASDHSRFSDEEMIEVLRQLFQDRGYLSGMVIDETERLPSSSAYQSRFGSLLRAYELVGFTPDRDYRYIEINRALRRMYPHIVTDIIAGIEQAGGSVKQDPATDLLTVNGEFTTSIVVVRCRTTAAGSLRWHIRFDVGLWPDITVAVRMDQPNQSALDYYLLPRIDMTVPRLRLAQDNGISLDAYRFESP